MDKETGLQPTASQCSHCGYWLRETPALCPECGQQHHGDEIVLLGWARYPMQLRRATSPWPWAAGVFLVLLPWAIVRITPTSGIWASATSSVIALVLGISFIVQRTQAGIPQTVRVVIRRDGILQEPTARRSAMLAETQLLLTVLYVALCFWGGRVAGSVWGFPVGLWIGFAVLVPLFAHRRPLSRSPVPWSEASLITLRATAPGRARLSAVSMTKDGRKGSTKPEAVDADVDLDADQLRWLEGRIAALRNQGDVR